MVHKDIYHKEACIQIYPTTRGWTVRAYKRDPKFKEKKWILKESTVSDHKTTNIKHAVDSAYEWLKS